MKRALRRLALVSHRYGHVVWLLVAAALILQWTGLALWLGESSPYLDRTRPLMLVLAAGLSLLILLLGIMWHAVLRDIRTSEHELARVATTDMLTGVLNRRGFMSVAGQEFTRTTRYERPLSVLSIDIDHLKHVNDAHGHKAGDAVLKSFTVAWQSVLRITDRIGRMGGEEFAILLPETDTPQARELAERIRNSCERLAFTFLPAGTAVTVSVGVASVQTGDSSIEHALARADHALNQAKLAGRNRVHAPGDQATR